MERLDIALQVIRDDITGKGEVKSTTESLQQLKLLSDILKTSPVPPNMFKKLSFILRRCMIHLYRITIKSALQYAAATFAIISDIKWEGSAECRTQWDNAQDSLLSGILNKMQQVILFSKYIRATSEFGHILAESQSLVASFFHEPLCGEFFPRQDKPVIYAQDHLLCTAFQLLSETVVSHPINQHKLRDSELLGGRRLGLMLAHCRDFLTVEALLELFGNIIPSGRKQERRSRFIEDVFNPTQFKCSVEIAQILERATSAGWDSISSAICDSLAKSDIVYPQPFEITQIRTTETSYTVSRIYIDKSAFTASVDEGGQLETFKVPFHTVQEIRITAPSALMARVVAVIAAPPLLGHTFVITKADMISVDFDIKKEKFGHFIKVLRQRGLKNIVASDHRKQSMAETHVNLAFQSIEINNPPPLEEKIENLARLWKSRELPDEPNHSSTSPLHKVVKPDDTVPQSKDHQASSVGPVELRTSTGKESTVPASIQANSRLGSFLETTNKELCEVPYEEALDAGNRQIVDIGSRMDSYTPSKKKTHNASDAPQTKRPSGGTLPIPIDLTDREVGLPRIAPPVRALLDAAADVYTELPSSVPRDRINASNEEIATTNHTTDESLLLGKPTYEHRKPDQEGDAPGKGQGARTRGYETLQGGPSPGAKGKPTVAFLLLPESNVQYHLGRACLRDRLPPKSPTLRTSSPTGVHARRQERSSLKPITSRRVTYERTPRLRNSDRTSTIDRIANVLEQIHEAVATNLVEKFDDVRKDIHLTQHIILEAARDDLSAMHGRSVRHYEQLVNLANEYAMHGRKTIHALGQSLDAETDVTKRIGDIIRQHDRHSLSSRFPDIASPAIPECLNTGST